MLQQVSHRRHSLRSVAVVLLICGASCTQSPNGSQPDLEASSRVVSALRQRVQAPHEETIATYIEAGAEYARPHTLTTDEWALMERALADLPPLFQRTLEQRLARLSFVEAPSSSGTALTRKFDGPDGKVMFDITIRADVLEASLTDFLTNKEQMVFSDDGSGLTVHILAGTTPALPYLLLHEAMHVVDNAFGIVTSDGPFNDIWTDYRALTDTYASDPIGVSAYRRGPKLPLARSPALYEALKATPFVSLYATSSAGEDVAELAAWSELSKRFHTPLVIQVRNAGGKVVATIEPLKSAAVQSRMRRLDEVLAAADDKERRLTPAL